MNRDIHSDTYMTLHDLVGVKVRKSTWFPAEPGRPGFYSKDLVLTHADGRQTQITLFSAEQIVFTLDYESGGESLEHEP